MDPTYSFAHRWRLRADAGEVYDVLVDVERYPYWWPQVRAVGRLGPDHALVLCKSWLPVDLWLTLLPAQRDRRAGRLEVDVDGDLRGWCAFELTQDGDDTAVEFRQEVQVTKPWMRRTHPVARPLFRANHAAMMASARSGLESTLATTTPNGG